MSAQKHIATEDALAIEPIKHLFQGGRMGEAYALAEELYRGRLHWTGVSLLEHVSGVLKVLLPFEPDEDTLITCLLHHALETRQVTLMELEEQFGTKVRSFISGVHLLSHVTMANSRNSIEDLRLMLLSVSDDVRVIFIILCDRCYVLTQLAHVPHEEQRRLCQDVLNLFAPVAARLGIHTLKQRLELLAFPIVYPADAERIGEQMEGVARRYGKFLPKAAAELSAALKQQGIASLVDGREKQSYSVFMKMKAKSLSSVLSMSDLFALRVVVATEEECYRVLGMLHRLGRPVQNRFKDYIAFPKPNGYQSLHTTIAQLPGVPENMFIEVQVRTHEMHREAEYGIAAHWSYKEGGMADRALQRLQLHTVLASQHSTVESEREESSLVDHIFVLTPKGDIVELPEGATPLDFAFQIHTDVGLAFRAAHVNGSIVPLDYALENGDVVEIVKHRVPRPSPEWLQLLKMASSRSRLKRHLYALNRDAYVAHGRDLLNEELVRMRLPPLDPDLTLLRLSEGKMLSVHEREDLLLKLGQGGEPLSAILARIDALKSTLQAPQRKVRLQRKDVLIEIEGNLPMPMRFAKCCKPNENHPLELIGSITRSADVVVHARGCKMLRAGNPERRIKVKWRK
ncbi:MAG: HD domain-containing protein [Candidatus Peregrinibacteria bacterium]|nr:HD domain-containing protein [Candidatus Peregrinibacteria bacterium]